MDRLKIFLNSSLLHSFMALFKNKHIRKLLDLYRDIWAINSAEALMGWDLDTYMPKSAHRYRGIALGRLSTLSQRLMLSEEFRKQYDKARREKNLTIEEKGILRVLGRELHYYDSLPPNFLRELARTTTNARKSWLIAKKRKRYEKFLPSLKKIIELSRRKAELLGYKDKPYDALLDLYEEGLTTKRLEPLFRDIKHNLPRIVKKILVKRVFPMNHELESKKYNKEAMEELSKELLKRIGYPFNRGRLDVSAHPFTIDISPNDVRITTWYPEKNFRESLLTTIHEFGHALYELQISKSLSMTPIGIGVGLGIHESQSRFWENIVAKSKQFIDTNLSLFKKHLSILDQYDSFELYRYFNTVKPSLIRVKADEVTYNLHILVRFEIEKEMINKDIDPRELPVMWNEKMEKYLGITPKNDAEGILQDVHWSQGSIGYFPTYTIGTLLAAQIARKMDRQIKLYKRIEEEDYSSIRKWLRERIHKYGSIYTPERLIRIAIGESLDPEVFMEYIRRKYLFE